MGLLCPEFQDQVLLPCCIQPAVIRARSYLPSPSEPIARRLKDQSTCLCGVQPSVYQFIMGNYFFSVRPHAFEQRTPAGFPIACGSCGRGILCDAGVYYVMLVAMCLCSVCT